MVTEIKEKELMALPKLKKNIQRNARRKNYANA